MINGWVKVHREIQNHWIWQEPAKLKWWIDLILMANHKENKIVIDNEIINIERGAFHTSEVKLSERWKVDRKTVRKFLALLEKDNMIELSKSRKIGTTIKLCNYNSFQNVKEDNMDNSRDNHGNKETNNYKDITKDNHMDNDIDKNKDNTRDNGVDINKNEKKEKNVKNDKKEKNDNNDKKDIVGSSRSVYETFESNGFGLLSPIVIGIIDDLVDNYGEEYVKDAVKVAVSSGKRSLKYVQGILKNWMANGRDDENGKYESNKYTRKNTGSVKVSSYYDFSKINDI